MTDTIKLPAAQYLRMSTEHQQYSLDNQSDAIAKYAARASFRGCVRNETVNRCLVTPPFPSQTEGIQ
jgi:hypothetical protein